MRNIDNGMVSAYYSRNTEPVGERITEPKEISNVKHVIKSLYAVNAKNKEAMTDIAANGYYYAEDVEILLDEYIRATALLKDLGVNLYSYQID